MIGQFLRAMSKFAPPDSRIMGCQFRGDPNDDLPGKWRARVVDDERMIDQGANVYLCVSAMKRNARGEYRRRKENFAGGLCLMIDDLGNGPGSKFPLTILKPLPPTALIETSPANFQAVYLFNRPMTDREEFEGMIRAFIAAQFLGNDPGMSGVNRVFRPPAGVNGKAKYGGGWKVRSAAWHPERRYAPEELVRAFGLTVHRGHPRVPQGATGNRAEGIRAFLAVRSALRGAGMLKSESANMEGWIDIHCPWRAEHTSGADNGAGIREPADENGWSGAFRCHHAGCASRGWRELTEWLTDEVAEVLEMVNQRAGGWNDD